MQSSCLLLPLALSSLVLSMAQNVIETGPTCLGSSPADDGMTRVTFLREDPAGVRSLYLSRWSEDMRLVACEVHTNSPVTERYRALCDRRGAQDQEILQVFNISILFAPDAPCASVSSSAPKFPWTVRRDGTEGKTRRKRAWIFPGTLWCGTGSRALRYEQLGKFQSADRCCREHDHCLHIIPALTANYGLFNYKFYTVSHCDCDQRFRQCLQSVNDSVSDMVGYSFFSFLQVPCFELKQQRHKDTKKALYAIFKSPLPYSTTDVKSKNGVNTDSKRLTSDEGQHGTECTMNSPHTKSCTSEVPPRGDAAFHRGTNRNGSKRHEKLSTVAPSQSPSISRGNNTTVSMENKLENLSNKKRGGKKKITGKSLSAYKRSEVPLKGTSKPYPQTTSTTQKHALELHLPTAITAVTKSYEKVPTQSRCCGFSLRGDAFHRHCKSCPERNMTFHMTTVTPSATTYGLPIKVTTLETLRLKKTREPSKQETWFTVTSARRATAKLETTASHHEPIYSRLLWKSTSQVPVERTKDTDPHAERGLKRYFSLYNMRDYRLVCSSLKQLDECRYKIRPLERKYDLQSNESKTTYHCDCTNRAAFQIERLKRPSIVPALLMDFVSQYCFRLPKEKECDSRKSCSRGFTKASDLLQALKKIEAKGTARVRKSGDGRKRGIPVRLFKRCLRLEKEADDMAQLT